MRSLRAFATLLRTGGQRAAGRLFALMVLGGLTEGFGVLLLVPLLELLQPSAGRSHGITRALLDGLRRAGVEPSATVVLAFFIVLIALRSAVLYGRELQAARLEHAIVDRLRERCFRALMTAEWRWLVRGRESDRANFLLTEVSRVGTGLHFGLGLLASLVALVAYLVAALALSWPMTLFAIASGSAAFLLLAGERRRALQIGESLGQANRALQHDVQESLAGIKLAKILGQEQRHVARFLDTARNLREQQMRFLSGTGRSRMHFQLGGALLLAAYLYIGLTITHTPTPALLTLVLVFGRLVPLCMQAQAQHYQWLHTLPALDETERLLAESRAAAEPDDGADAPDWAVASTVRLDGVTIRHAGREQPALDSVSILFPARTTTALMGPSGAGKSTIADVLMGLLVPDAGTLHVDGVAMTGGLRRAWRRAVAYVPQETFLFHDTIRNNLLWAAPQAGDDALRAALRRAAADFVFALPDQLDTVVGDRGARFSGGERQRLALARALLARPSLLILDEATSALDVDNEARVRHAIEQLHGDITVVIIGHRLPTLEHADQVVILDSGRVIAQGTWAQTRARAVEAGVTPPTIS